HVYMNTILTLINHPVTSYPPPWIGGPSINRDYDQGRKTAVASRHQRNSSLTAFGLGWCWEIHLLSNFKWLTGPFRHASPFFLWVANSILPLTTSMATVKRLLCSATQSHTLDAVGSGRWPSRKSTGRWGFLSNDEEVRRFASRLMDRNVIVEDKLWEVFWPISFFIWSQGPKQVEHTGVGQ
ncbi:hypothetical protein GOODEAATRI_034019, partial [Goodea atripinnis]